MVGQEEIFRKGPWTEQEDRQLVFYVNLFGDRRWDSIAKVSGLKRAGKSCRLRWVNYLHPGLKRGKMTPHEEQLVLQLQSKWGNRWSRIARKLPGRTDNEIKNYWRTHMRKRAQERKQGMSPPPSSSISNCSSSLSSNNARGNPMPIVETKGPNFYDTGGFLAPSLSMISKSSSSSSINPPVDTITMETKERSFYDTGGVEALGKKDEREEDQEGEIKVYPMDDIWKDIGFSEESLNLNYSNCPAMATSPVWNYNYCPDLPWMMEGDESKLFPTMNTDNFFSGNDLASSNFTG